MNAITIELPDKHLSALKKRASSLGISPEELVRLTIEDILTQPDEQFQQAIQNVFEKNQELYRRLA